MKLQEMLKMNKNCYKIMHKMLSKDLENLAFNIKKFKPDKMN